MPHWAVSTYSNGLTRAFRSPEAEQWIPGMAHRYPRASDQNRHPDHDLELPMFQELIDDYRRQARQYIADALELESGRWRVRDQDGDQSTATALRKRAMAAMLNRLAEAYEEQER